MDFVEKSVKKKFLLQFFVATIIFGMGMFIIPIVIIYDRYKRVWRPNKI